MSLVALTTHDHIKKGSSFIVMIGDVLFSKEHRKNNQGLPTFVNGADHLLPNTQVYFPADLRQKIYVITDRLIIGLVGWDGEMEMLLEDLKTHISDTIASKEKFTFEDIVPFLGNYPVADRFPRSQAIIGYMQESGGFIVMNLGGCDEYKTQRFGTTYSCGSGSATFSNWLKAENPIANATFDENNPRNFINKHLTFLGSLVAREKLTLQTLKEAWGAAYELIYWNGTKFVKHDNISYLMFNVPVTVPELKADFQSFFLYNCRYYDDLLLISTWSFSDQEPHFIFVVPPIDDYEFDIAKIIQQKHIAAHYDSDHVVTTFLLKFEKLGEHFTTHVVDSSTVPENESKKIEIIEHSELKIETKIDPEFAQMVLDLGINVFKR